MKNQIHLLKTTSELYRKVLSGEKTFDVRKNDRNFQVGDILVLAEVSEDTREFTIYSDSVATYKVTFILDSSYHAIAEDYVVMAIVPSMPVRASTHYARTYNLEKSQLQTIYLQVQDILR